MSTEPAWSVYVLRTAAGALYAGIATDVTRRLAEHAAGRGARSLRGRGPLTLVWSRAVPDRSTALRVEARLKRLGKDEKELLVAGDAAASARVDAWAAEPAEAPAPDPDPSPADPTSRSES
ncbi:MAG: GIY-YIG nuclease family protein [Gemmatimonadetes bacterium]|nr:GIY-YIG nuclease family protein [Gemmatimonadota bacterium]